MAKKDYAIRLYRAHDLDIIAYIESHEFNMIKAVYSALHAFCEGEVFVIEIPPKKKGIPPTKRRKYCKSLRLDTEKDAKAIALLSKIAPGYRNNFLKNLLRMYLCTPLSENFLTNKEDMDEFVKMFAILKKGKRCVKAGKTSKKATLNMSSQNKTTKEERSLDNIEISEVDSQVKKIRGNEHLDKQADDITDLFNSFM